jgi:hypothetical protein
MSENIRGFELDISNDDFTVVRLADGLGFGDGSISRHEREAMPGNEDLAYVTDRALRSPDILVPVGRDDNGEFIEDDGCIDGRPVADEFGAVFRGMQILKSSLHRPKVPGGGVNMVFAARVGMGLDQGQTPDVIFDNSIAQAESRNLKVGAHIDGHAHGPNCGCTALDKPAEHFMATKLYRPQIAETVQLLAGHAPELHAIRRDGNVGPGVLDHYVKAAESTMKVEDFSGKLVVDKLVQANAVVKRLDEDHRETRIALNEIEDTTINQAFLREQTDGRAQVFGFDVWRLNRINEKLYDDPAEQRVALLSQLVHSLGITAVLTKGDLPVDLYRAA